MVGSAGNPPVTSHQSPITRAKARGSAIQHAHDVAFLHDQQLLAVDLDLGAGPLAEQHLVAFLDVESDDLSSLVAGAWADGDDFALLRLLGGGVGDDDAAGTLGFLVDAAYDHAVVKGTKLHAVNTPGSWRCGNLRLDGCR